MSKKDIKFTHELSHDLSSPVSGGSTNEQNHEDSDWVEEDFIAEEVYDTIDVLEKEWLIYFIFD